MITKFLFMDEKYPDNGAPRRSRVTSLTGVLVSAEVHNVFRERFYSLAFDVLGRKKGVVLPPPKIHASELLPELGDNDEGRFGFLREMIQLVNDLDCRIYRIGYYSTENLRRMYPDEKSVVGLCFMSMLFVSKQNLSVQQYGRSWRPTDPISRTNHLLDWDNTLTP